MAEIMQARRRQLTTGRRAAGSDALSTAPGSAQARAPYGETTPVFGSTRTRRPPTRCQACRMVRVELPQSTSAHAPRAGSYEEAGRGAGSGCVFAGRMGLTAARI